MSIHICLKWKFHLTRAHCTCSMGWSYWVYTQPWDQVTLSEGVENHLNMIDVAHRCNNSKIYKLRMLPKWLLWGSHFKVNIGYPKIKCLLHSGSWEEGKDSEQEGTWRKWSTLCIYAWVVMQSWPTVVWPKWIQMDTVIVSFSCQLDTNLKSPGKSEPLLMNFPDQIGLWPYLWSIFLVFNRCMRGAPSECRPIPR